MDRPTPPPERVAVRLAPSRKRVQELALVLQAVGLPHELVRLPQGWALVVHASLAPRVEEELSRYERENVGFPHREERFRPIPGAALGAVVYVAVIAAVFVLSRLEGSGDRWWSAGRAVAARIREGEAWRAVTALTLHTDISHIAGNAVFGAVFGVLLAQVLGGGAAWAQILAAGAVGNLVNAWVGSADHTSVGASTAVFGALGLLAAVQWRRWGRRRGGALLRLTPILAAGVLLGMLGTGGERTDIGAHVFGFAAGVLLGALDLLHGERPLGPRLQVALGSAALLVLAGAWALALA